MTDPGDGAVDTTAVEATPRVPGRTTAKRRAPRRSAAVLATLTSGPLALGTDGAAPRRVALPRWMTLLLIIGVQVVASYLMTLVASVALIQGLAVFAAAGYAILRRDLILSLGVIAYLAGSEVLWRQIRPPIPYLFGPYLVIGLSAFGLFVVVGQVGRRSRLALFYVLLLLPSVLLTFQTAGSNSREFVVFALSGPFALAFLVAVASQVQLEPWVHRRLLWTLVIGILGPWTVAVARIQEYIVNTGSLNFNDESNFVTAGGFGPVQVSSALGLGVLVAVLLVLSETTRTIRLIALVIGVALAVQSFLTFSRGGMTAVGISVAALVIMMSRDRENRRRVYVSVGVALMIGYFLLLPRLDAFTGGAFNERFTDTETTRTELAANDIEIFKRHPLFGVGPGMTKFQRLTYEICQIRSDRCSKESSSHTEFTRLLGEHGISGIVAIGVLALIAFRGVAGRTQVNQVFGVTLIVWAVAQMFYANLRIVAVPIAFGFAFLTVGTGPPPGTPTPAGRRQGRLDNTSPRRRHPEAFPGLGSASDPTA